MSQVGVATERPRRRQAEIWSDEVSWEPPRRTRRQVAADPRSAGSESRVSAEDAAWLEAAAAITARAAAPAPAPVPHEPLPSAPPAVPVRRTIKIHGRGAERPVPRRPGVASGAARRPTVPRHERPGFHADRIAMWAVVLGILLVIVAATSAHAAVLAHSL